MNSDQLIAKQQLEIEDLKERVADQEERLRKIHMACICIGGPLNDNVKQYTRAQMGDFFLIDQLAAGR